MAYVTITSLKFYSRRMKEFYNIIKFVEYKVDIDLETDADGFNVIISNPNGEYTGIINKFDPIELYINNIGVLSGTVDMVEYSWGANGSTIQIVGRDLASVFVDNDAIPVTKYNIKPGDYISSKCTEYGIKKKLIDTSIPTIQKLIIGTGESEISIMSNLLINSNRRLWTIFDTIYAGKWNTGATHEYVFTRGLPQGSPQNGTPIESLSYRDDGTDMKSEIRIYGSMNDGTEKVTGTAKNDYMISQGIKKRSIRRSYNDDASSKYASSALESVRDSFRNNIALEVNIKTGSTVVLPNRTALVIDTITGLNSVFFIKSVSFMKNARGGSTTAVTMIPSDPSFNIIWTNQSNKEKGNLLGTPKMTIDELLKSRK